MLTVGTTDYTASLNATTGAYEIVIDPTSYTFSGGNGVLSVPKREIGYGNRELSVTIRTTDESSVNESVTETTALSVFSTIPPVPFVQPVTALDLTDSADWSGTGIPLLDLIRIPEANESHVLELVNLSNGVTVQIGSQPVATSPLASGAGIYSVHSTNPFETISVVRIPFADLANATIVLDAGIMAGSTSLDFDARVGTSDGGIDGDPANGTRYVYSKLVETSITVNSSSAGDDIVFSDGSSDDSLGSGDDVVVVTASSGQGDLFGGDGVDTLDLSTLTGSQGAIVDLNLQKLILPNTGNTGSVRDLTGFEVIQGSEQSDTFVGNDSSNQPIIIRGGGGSDRIIAGKGDDVIEGGSGSDSLTGGEGVDTFVFTPDSGDDRIEDFNLGGDKLVFAGFGLTFLSDGNWPSEVAVEASGADLKISITSNGSTQTLTLAGLAASVASPELRASSEFTETLDLDAPNLGIDLSPAPVDYAQFIADRDYREQLLGDNFEFSDDGLSSVLGVIADVKLEEAIIRNSASATDGVRSSIDPSTDANGAYVGLAGSLGDDFIIGTDYDDLLFGGLDGEDKIIGGLGDDDILISRTRGSGQQEDQITVSGDGGADIFTFIEADTVQQGLENISQAHDVLIKDFNRAEGDRLQLVGYDDLNEVTIGDVDANNHQTVVLEDGLTVMFDLSFAREFDSNFALRLADFDKFEG